MPVPVKKVSTFLLLLVVMVTILDHAQGTYYKKKYGYRKSYGYRRPSYRRSYYGKSYYGKSYSRPSYYGKDNSVYVKQIYVPYFVKSPGGW